ncbi:MAG TPA: methylated-DNA--[protein]-cysteine S-methyltransferase [Chitinophagaceae bacterium]|nr:methylated-DNA--[protein]-cysteine S-methyltransferase [Chitinophagaceae bacterium]
MADSVTTYYHSPLGLLRLTGTADFISEISFFDKVEKAESRKKNLPPLLIQCIEELIQYFHGQRRQFTVPVNQAGTPFQKSVWSELMSIPFGKTVNYLELARRTGDIKATRAVASANAKNSVAIIVPCHRVIGVNRELVGYMGGIWRKKWLLEHEARLAYGVQTLF